jgi:hypothetical protein
MNPITGPSPLRPENDITLLPTWLSLDPSSASMGVALVDMIAKSICTTSQTIHDEQHAVRSGAERKISLFQATSTLEYVTSFKISERLEPFGTREEGPPSYRNNAIILSAYVDNLIEEILAFIGGFHLAHG